MRVRALYDAAVLLPVTEATPPVAAMTATPIPGSIRREPATPNWPVGGGKMRFLSLATDYE